jgi:hypothetical protein
MRLVSWSNLKEEEESNMGTMTAEQALDLVFQSKADQCVRHLDEIRVGQVIHQGDVYLHCVADDHPRGELLGTRQVAAGMTQGARHVVVGSNVEVYAGVAYPEWVSPPVWCRDRDLLGPVVVASEPSALTHPEHAHVEFPKRTFQVTYQGDFATMRPVQD